MSKRRAAVVICLVILACFLATWHPSDVVAESWRRWQLITLVAASSIVFFRRVSVRWPFLLLLGIVGIAAGISFKHTFGVSLRVHAASYELWQAVVAWGTMALGYALMLSGVFRLMGGPNANAEQQKSRA